MMAIWNLIKKISGHMPSLQPHILFHSNGLDIWHGVPNQHGFSDISNIKVNKTFFGREM